MLFEGINAIVRAAGVEAAPRSQPWAERLLVQSNQQNRRFRRYAFDLPQHDGFDKMMMDKMIHRNQKRIILSLIIL
jgi:hypothetical protein